MSGGIDHGHGPRAERAADVEQLPGEQGRALVRRAAIVAGAGVLLSTAAAVADHRRFAFSYLTAFVWVATLGLGALFFVLIQHLTRAGWSIAARRHMEWLTAVLPACAVLFAPVALCAHQLYEHWMGAHDAHDALLHKKSGYLNPPFFFTRAAIFILAWSGISWWFARRSREQDTTRDPRLTERMQSRSAPATLVFAVTLTFAAFDWLMSLDPHWYSTIFGVYVFSGSVTSSLSALALLTIALQRAGLLNKVSTVEHRHDIGKLLFGFVVFWAYIAFSQYFLIWYANIPEETIFFKHRWAGSWKVVSLTLLFGHFVVPFLALLSRAAKRSGKVLAGVAVLLLAMHWLDLYWLVMPTLDEHGAHFTWIDVAAFAGPLGVALLVVAAKAAQGPLFPIADPRLPETMRVENL